MKIKEKLKYALVLSGGGARGLVHVGFLCALEDEGYPLPSLIAGTSMGAIIGGLYASGMSGPELKRYVLEELDISNFMESSVFKMDGPIGKLFQTGQIIGHAATRPGVDSGDKVLRIMERLTKHKKIENCEIPFLCNAVDLCAGEEVIIRSGSLARAIRASMSFPFVFEPLIEGSKCLVDGGVADNLPVKSAREAARELGIRRILAVDTRRWQNIPAGYMKNGLSVVMRCFDAMIHVSETAGESELARANLLIHASDKTSAFDFSRKRELMELGEAAAVQSKTELDAFFGKGIKGAVARRRKVSCGIEMEGYYKVIHKAHFN
ncbi:MAG: patatin-like phospholipase family protein [Treponema sp.]|nr:patatin-like phospholipase family protein [Treponema sp.]